MKNKVLFLGSKPIGHHCLKHLIEFQKKYNIEIIGVLTNNTNRLGQADLTALCQENNIKLLFDINDILNLDCDFLISVQYHEILKKEHIQVAKKAAINLHMAPLPEYRGCNQFTFAIIDDKNEFGTTLHMMDEGIDSGDILAESRFEIPKNCFVQELYDLTYKASCELFDKHISNIFQEVYKPIPQSHYLNSRTSSIHYRKDINEAKTIDLNWDKEKIWRHIRATSMPGFTPPYAIINDKKLNLIIEE